MEVLVTRISSTDELYHHKYIERKKINGKWRYIYVNKSGADVNRGRQLTTLGDIARSISSNGSSVENTNSKSLTKYNTQAVRKTTYGEYNRSIVESGSKAADKILKNIGSKKITKTKTIDKEDVERLLRKHLGIR